VMEDDPEATAPRVRTRGCFSAIFFAGASARPVLASDNSRAVRGTIDSILKRMMHLAWDTNDPRSKITGYLGRTRRFCQGKWLSQRCRPAAGWRSRRPFDDRIEETPCQVGAMAL